MEKMAKQKPWFTVLNKPESIKEMEMASMLVEKLLNDEDNYKEKKETIKRISLYFKDLRNLSEKTKEHVKLLWKTTDGGKNWLEMERVSIQNCSPISHFLQHVRCECLFLLNVTLTLDDCIMLISHVFDDVKCISFDNVELSNIEQIEKDIPKLLAKKNFIRCEQIEFLHSSYYYKGTLESWQKKMKWKRKEDNNWNQIIIFKK